MRGGSSGERWEKEKDRYTTENNPSVEEERHDGFLIVQHLRPQTVATVRCFATMTLNAVREGRSTCDARVAFE